MSRVKSGKVHFIFGIISLIIIVTAAILMRLSTIAEGIVWILFILVMAPVAYLWINRAKKHDHGYTDRDFRQWSHKHKHHHS